MCFSLFPFSFSCFEHIECLPVISWFWNFMSLIGRFQFLVPICFLKVIYPTYKPDTMIINWNMRNTSPIHDTFFCLVFFPALLYTSHESHIMFSANISKDVRQLSWISRGVMCSWFLLNFLFISAFFDILASLSISHVFSSSISGRWKCSCSDIPRTIIKFDYIN